MQGHILSDPNLGEGKEGAPTRDCPNAVILLSCRTLEGRCGYGHVQRGRPDHLGIIIVRVRLLSVSSKDLVRPFDVCPVALMT